MKRAFWICGGLVIGAAQVASAGDAPSGSTAAPLGSISLSRPSTSLASAAIGEAGPRDNWGVYLRGALLWTGYADADYDTTALGGEDRSVDFDLGLGASAAVGYRFWNFASSDPRGMGFRVEGEFTYEQADANDGEGGLSKLELMGFAANGYLDIAFAQRWTWYFGGGIGIANADPSGGGVSGTDNPLFAQLMSGFTHTWGGPLSVYGGLRVRAYEEMEFNDAKLDSFASGALEFGVVLSF